MLIEFGVGGQSDRYCLSGWAEAEPGERWMLGSQARLRLPAPDGTGACTLVLRLRPFVDRARLPAQRLVVKVNGVELARFTLRDRTTRAVAVPARLIRHTGTLEIALLAPDAARPLDLGVGRDDRCLSVALSGLVVQPDPHAPEEVAEDDETSIDIAAIAAADRMTQAELMIQFESLGQNCEFGLVQRACGAEPLGLLRFSSTPLPKLLNALDAGFVGMGLPDSLDVVPSANGEEYMVHDQAFGFRYHAWVKANERSPGEVLQRELRRVPFLVRKLVSDLETADKTFVFRGMGALPEEEVFPLAVALRRYGPNTLLFVTLADAGTGRARWCSALRGSWSATSTGSLPAATRTTSRPASG